MAKKEVKCPWCGSVVSPKVVDKKQGDVAIKESLCPDCNKVLAAYAANEGDFMPRIRVFEN